MKELQCSLLSMVIFFLFSATSWADFTLTVDIKNISDNTTVTQIEWSDTAAIWNEADQYLEIDYQSSEAGWGVQVYTDNKKAGADPAYTGTTAEGWEGAGLVGVVDSTMYVPMAWTVLDSLGSRPAITYDPLNYNVLLANNGWAYFKDKMQTAGSYPFTNGEEYITIVNGNGMAKNDGAGRYAGATSPIVVYLIADFTGKPNQTYQTNQLIIELYHQ